MNIIGQFHEQFLVGMGRDLLFELWEVWFRCIWGPGLLEKGILRGNDNFIALMRMAPLCRRRPPSQCFRLRITLILTSL